MDIKINALETKRFGMTCAQIPNVSVAVSDLNSINKQAGQLGVAMLSVRVDVSSLHQIHALEADGYRLMDTLVCYGGAIQKIGAAQLSSEDVELRVATPADIPDVSEVAQSAFKNYFGHYHADPRLDSRAADAAYVQWAESSLVNQTPDTFVAVAVVQEKVRGFVTTRNTTNDGIEIVLNAVHPDFQGRGLYSRLLGFAGKLAESNGVKTVGVSTQIQNYAVQRVWVRFGLAHERSFYTLHKWFD